MRERLDSLDVFRGLTVAAMILVSAPGTWEAVYRPLDHAIWHGWTPTDLIFPFFLFAMGAAVPVALERRRGIVGHVRRHVLRRALVLFSVGLLLNALSAASLNWTTFRIPGVLQRIALVYAAVAWLTGMTSRRTQAIVAAGLLLGYWGAMMWVPVPGAGAGVLTPEGNLAWFLDRLLLHHHLAFAHGDPEGVLSTLPAIATALGGVFAGDWLMRAEPLRHRGLKLWAAGAIATFIGLLWARAFPINKNLWTSSFAVFSAGMATQLLAVCYWVCDVRRWRSWLVPFRAFGRNALVAYTFSIGVDSVLTRWNAGSHAGSLKSAIYHRAFSSWIAPRYGPEAASLSYAVAYLALCAAVVVAMYRRRLFVSV